MHGTMNIKFTEYELLIIPYFLNIKTVIPRRAVDGNECGPSAAISREHFFSPYGVSSPLCSCNR